MTLLYEQQKTSIKDGINGDKTYVEILSILEGEYISVQINKPIIIFILMGSGTLNSSIIEKQKVGVNEILLFAPHFGFTMKAEIQLKILICRIEQWSLLSAVSSEEQTIDQCKQNLEQHLRKGKKADSNNLHKTLIFNSRINSFLNSFVPCYDDGFMFFDFFELKIKELFILLRSYYAKQDLKDFFRPLLSYDYEFSKFVWENYRTAHNVRDLAMRSKHCLSSFNLKFKRTFGVSALKWMNERKAYNIHHDLVATNKNFKEISSEYHLASVTHLNGFCREHLKQTPGQIRKGRSLTDKYVEINMT